MQKLDEKSLENLASALKNGFNMISLDLSSSELNEKGIKIIGKGLEYANSLQTLILSNFSFTIKKRQ